MITPPRFSPERTPADASTTRPNSAPTKPRYPRHADAADAPASRRGGGAEEVMTHDFLLANLHPELVRDALAAEERRLCAIDL